MHIKYSTESFAFATSCCCGGGAAAAVFDSILVRFMCVIFFFLSFKIIISAAAWCLERSIAFVAILSRTYKRNKKKQQHSSALAKWYTRNRLLCTATASCKHQNATAAYRWWPQKYRSRRCAFANASMYDVVHCRFLYVEIIQESSRMTRLSTISIFNWTKCTQN